MRTSPAHHLQDKPTFVEVMVYFGYWVIILCVAFYKWRTGSLFDADYKYKRQMAKQAKLAGQEAASSGSDVDAEEKALAIVKGAKDAELERGSGSGGSVSQEGGNGGVPTVAADVPAEAQAPAVQRIQG
jgi:hypothetical protein